MEIIRFKLTVFALFLFTFGFAQTTTNTESLAGVVTLPCDSSTSSFVIQGTSSLHDWEMTSQACKGALNVDLDGQNISIEGIQVKVLVTSLKSGKRIMDNKCYDALKSDDHPNIIYRLSSISSIKNKGQNNYQAVLDGSLDIAGVKKPIQIDVSLKKSNNIITIKGTKSVKMTDFNVKPPKALLGTLKTGDEITIIFNLNFVES